MTRIGVALWTAFSVSLLLYPATAQGLLYPATAQGQCRVWDLNGDWTFVSSAGTSIFHLEFKSQLEGTVETKNNEGLLGGVWHGKVFGKADSDKLQLNVYWETGTTTVFEGTITGGRLEGYSYQLDKPEIRQIWNTSRVAKCWLTATSPVCLKYGDTSVKQYNDNVKQNCGFNGVVKGIMWNSDAPKHWEHCRLVNENPNTLDLETKARDAALARCRELHQNVEIIDKPDAPSHQVIEKKLGRVPLSFPQKSFAPPPLPICEAARQAAARNSPAAPGLEAQCRAAGGTP